MLSVSQITIGLIIPFVVVISVTISAFVNFADFDEKIANRLKRVIENRTWQSGRKQLRIGNESDHFMWFVQISDIHISVLNDISRQTDLKEFVTKTVDVIKPPVVVASGDLTHARPSFSEGSRPVKREWEIYKRILDEANISNKTLWLDIRGNHDTYNVPSVEAEVNFFNFYSIQGRTHKHSYMKQVTVRNNKYSFIAIDACLNPGIKPPFNSMGVLDVNQTNAIIDLAEESRISGADYIIWFGHYPTPTLISHGLGNRGIKQILGQYDEGYVYLSGHLHTMFGLVPQMYAVQEPGFLELELGDWKDNRMYRVAAFDHGLFSFVDIKHGSWPVILITNPKNAQFNMPTKEDPILLLESTHIRILIFDPHKIIECKVRIDSEQFQICTAGADNLFVASWDPLKYKIGLHKIEVVALTEDGRTGTISQPFSLDGSRQMFPFGSIVVLKFGILSNSEYIFKFLIIMCTIPLMILRIWHELAIAKKCSRPKFYGSFTKRCIRKLWILSTVDRIFALLLLIALYILLGPWTMDELIDGHTGIVFSWGMYVNGNFIPSTLNYVFGCFQLVFCHFPLIVIYGHIVSERYCGFIGYSKLGKQNDRMRIFGYFSILVIIIIAFLYFYFRPLAAFFGTIRYWLIGANFLMFYWANTITKQNLQSALTVTA